MNQFDEFERDSKKHHGRILKGPYAHWCEDWDEMPIDATCDEFASCNCYNGGSTEIAQLKEAAQNRIDARNAPTVTGERRSGAQE